MAVQLVARGQQDVYITGKPSITYFSTIFKKNTPFVTEYVEYSFDGPVIDNGYSRCTIPPRGDVITDVTVKLVFPPLYTSPGTVYCYPVLPAYLTSPKMYVFNGSTMTLALQAVNWGDYWSTFSLSFWATQYLTDFAVTFSTTTTKFVYTSTNPAYTAVAFTDEFSAQFWGYDILNPTTSSPSFPTYYMYTLGSGTPQFTVLQAGWTNGYSPLTSNAGFAYTSSYAVNMVKEARLKIGGQLISRLPKDYLTLLYDYDIPYENQSALTALVGKGDTGVKYAQTTSFVKLPFLKNLTKRQVIWPTFII